MAMSMGPRKGAIADINVTPMADVMIVLLIIFMVATPLIASAPVRLPSAENVQERAGERIEIVVRGGGQVSIGRESFEDLDALADHVALRGFGASRTPTLLVQAERGVAYSEVARVLAACRRGGAAEVALATERAGVRR